MGRIREDQTIAAISTPLGPGGIGIVRMSGPKSLPILEKLFRPSASSWTPISHKLCHGHIVSPEANCIVDEVLAVYMKAPRTYTREDVVEIQCHAGYAVLNQILDLCIKFGARPAEPGEFTRRAFLNGRIDLVQAEAVADLSRAEALGLSRISAGAVTGRLSERIESVRQELAGCLAALEVAIDYPEEDAEIMDQARLNEILEEKIIRPLKALLDAFERTRIHRSGAAVMIAGRPNVGKSSLLNTLSCRDKAIVTDIPGTTRDIIEARIEIGGVCVTLLDTAGVRSEPDPIEAMGIEKIRELAPSCQLFLWLIDVSSPLRNSDRAVLNMLESHRQMPVIVVFNKIDKITEKEADTISKLRHDLAKISPASLDWPYCLISAKQQTGISRLLELIRQNLLGKEETLPEVAPNTRQKEIMEKCLHLAEQALDALKAGLSPEIPALDIRQALDYLGEITGETATEDILEQIFSRFCLGK